MVAPRKVPKGESGACLTDRSLRLIRVAVLLLADLCTVRSAPTLSHDCIASPSPLGWSRTSTHWRNSGSRSPMEAWTSAQKSSTQMARARKSGRSCILPAPVVVMMSSFN